MAVLLADLSLSVATKDHPWLRDSHGHPVAPEEPAELRGPWPGAAREQPDLSYTLRLDTRAWPVEPGDRITDGARTWVVASARINTVPRHPDADYIAIVATLEPPEVP
ncbi:hypothetical protein ABN028_20055 [Actinopolymorpha sp. B17G11]|uniref:hypothetical protein n=1 Tax=Actinopolymorpha sp. B17G11 TaxID=3160861 RepID=UPI0032E39D81